jgi:hypothetical protein
MGVFAASIDENLLIFIIRCASTVRRVKIAAPIVSVHHERIGKAWKRFRCASPIGPEIVL